MNKPAASRQYQERDDPTKTKVRARLGVVIPMRQREQQLERLLPILHKHLTEYGPAESRIVVVEQTVGEPFNRGMSLNVGVAWLENAWPAVNNFCLHDVDMLPLASADYSLVDEPTCVMSARLLKQPANHEQMSDDVVKQFQLLTDGTLGPKNPNLEMEMEFHYDPLGYGVLDCPADVFFEANGFSNRFWGWGDEDRDFVSRLLSIGHQVRGRSGVFEAADLGSHLFTPFGRRWCQLHGHDDDLKIGVQNENASWHGPAKVLNENYRDNAERLRADHSRRMSGTETVDDGVSKISLASVKSTEFPEYTHIVFNPLDCMDQGNQAP